MKKVLAIIILLNINSYIKSQCNVTISPQSSSTFCQGDSVVLVASANTPSVLTLDQNQGILDGTYSYLTSQVYWQSFTAGISGVLEKIQVRFASGNGNFLSIKIYQGTGTNGVLLQTSGTSVGCSGCYSDFNLNTTITAGMVYTFAFNQSSSVAAYYGNGNSGGATNYGTGFVFRTLVSTPQTTYYQWSNGATTSSIVAKSNGNYSVTITNSLSCTTSNSISVIVNPTPTVTIASTNTLLCSGQSATLIATGANTYTWSNGSNNNQIVIAPTANTTYSLVGVNANGCSTTASFNQLYTVCTSIANEIKNSDITYYPNPVVDELRIVFNNSAVSAASITFINVLGKEVYTTNITNRDGIAIDLKILEAGMYWFYINDNMNNVLLRKTIIKQ